MFTGSSSSSSNESLWEEIWLENTPGNQHYFVCHPSLPSLLLSFNSIAQFPVSTTRRTGFIILN